jgi:hypothetical protein
LGFDFAVEEEIEARGKAGQQEKRLRLDSRVKTGQYTSQRSTALKARGIRKRPIQEPKNES